MPDPSTYDPIFDAAANEWNVDPRLLKAVAMQESSGNPGTVSTAGARGLMGIMPETGKGLGITDQSDPAQNIFAGAKYLSEALDKEGSPEQALLYYHGGPDWRKNFGPESRGYVPAVASRFLTLAKADQPTGTAGSAAPAPTPAATTTLDPYADFRAQTGATPGAAAGGDDDPDYAQFRAQTGAVAPPVETPPVGGTAFDDEGRPIPAPPVSDEAVAAWRSGGQRVADAASGAFQGSENSVLTPASQAAVEKYLPLWAPIINPLARGAGYGLGALSALTAGGTEAASQAMTGLGVPSRLQEDVNALLQVAPAVAGMPEAGINNALSGRLGQEVGAPPPLSPFEQPRLGPPGPGQPGGAPPPDFIPPDTAPPPPSPLAPPAFIPPEAGTPGTPPPAGGAAGADVTTQPIPPKTQVERVRDLDKAVNQPAEERAGPQLVDNEQYVPGIPPRLLAGRDFSTSANALDEKVASASDPVFRDAVDQNRRDRNSGMIDFLRNDSQDATALDQAYEARAKVSPAEMGVFEDEKPVDAAPLAAKIDALLAGPEGKQAAVRNTLTSVRDSLVDNNGNLETLPSRLYGARKNLTDLLKRGVKGTGDVADDVRASKHFLEGLLPDFDQTIGEGAPQFGEYLKAWSDLSKPIDQMEFLQQYNSGSKKLTDSTGYLQPNKVQKMLDDVLQANKTRGVNKGQSLTDQQINNIEAVRNELAAQQLQDRLASVRGSDTFQQFNTRMLGEGPIPNALRHGVDVGAGVMTGGLYNWAIKPGLEANRLARVARRTAARKQELLSPPNPLQQP